VADARPRNSGRERTGAICYAVGWNHHTGRADDPRRGHRAGAARQCRPARRRHHRAARPHQIQGSTDIPTLYNMLPSYLPQPHAFRRSDAQGLSRRRDQPDRLVAQLPEIHGQPAARLVRRRAATANEWGYQWLPKIVGDHSQLPLTLAMNDGVIRGLFLMGQNVVMGGSNSR
jgi:formate dehydrogenase major subunit